MSVPEHREDDPRIPAPDTDRRHAPGPDALPLWNESFWFPLYDPDRDIGVIVRWGLYPSLQSGSANFYLAIIRGGEAVYVANHQRAQLPGSKPNRLALYNGLALEWIEPLRSFRLVFKEGDLGFDLTFTGMSPPFLYDSYRHGPAEVVPRHIEQGGRAQGTVTIDGRTQAFDGFAHRDHTFGGERDWNKFYRWNYFSGEFDHFWFNAVRIKFDPEMDWLYVGCLFDGERVRALEKIDIAVRTVQGGARPTFAKLTLQDDAGKVHHLETGSFHGVCPVLIWRTWVKDHIVQYRMGSSVGYGILEHGYRDEDRLAEFEND
jgi:hypothetical protein